MKIKIIQSVEDSVKWNAYVFSHPKSTLYHLSGWMNVIRKTYGHKTCYLMAAKDDNTVSGVLPLVHLRSFIFGNSLISIPFFDMGGILADDEETEKALLSEAVLLGKRVNAKSIELRHAEAGNLSIPDSLTRSHKVRMILDLPESSDILMNSFKAKLRNQIKKPAKEGLQAKIGGLELLEDFYYVFLINMRDLGSPIHSKNFIKNLLEEFPDKAKIVIVYKDNQPLACSLVIGFKKMLQNPWASALKEYSRLSPNMLLYWTMLEYGCNNGYTSFDFGRSTPGEGTYRFKEQWGARPSPLYWHYISLNSREISSEPDEKSKFDKAVEYWKKLPVSLTKIIGPLIRKHIGL